MTDVQAKLEAIVALVEKAKTKPLSGTVVLPRAELLSSLQELRDELPGQLSEAEKVLRERRSLLESARAESERLVSEARRQSERALDEARRNAERVLESARQERQALVEETSVLAEAEQDADRLVAEARAEALRMRAETDDYVDASLARFEALLEHTLATVGRGRDKLRELADPGLQQELPDPDGDVGMPSAPASDVGDALAATETERDLQVDLLEAEETVRGRGARQHGVPAGADTAALAR